VALAVVAIVAYVRLRLSSLWWLLALQLWTAGSPWLARLAMRPLMMRGQMGMGGALWPIYAAETALILIPFVLFLIFLILLMRDVSRLLVCLPAPAEAALPPPAE
jgi:hypothetical protein